MNFLGIGGLEFLLIFGVAMFFLGPRRLAHGVREGRKYYRELRRYRNELTSMVSEALDAEDLKKDLEKTKREIWDESDSAGLAGLQNDLSLGEESLDIPELELTRSVPNERSSSTGKKATEVEQDAKPERGSASAENATDSKLPANSIRNEGISS